jgi:prevent-host-death family protein
MSTINVSAARAKLPRLLDAVKKGEEVTLTRHGKPVAVLVRPDRLRDPKLRSLYAGADELRALVETGRSRPLGSSKGLTPRQADELVAEVRAGRDAR